MPVLFIDYSELTTRIYNCSLQAAVPDDNLQDFKRGCKKRLRREGGIIFAWRSQHCYSQRVLGLALSSDPTGRVLKDLDENAKSGEGMQ